MEYEGHSINKFTEWHDSINFQNIKNFKYTFYWKFNSEHMWKFFLMLTPLLWRHLLIEHSLFVYCFLHQ